MPRYSAAELEALLDETESDLAERKEAWAGSAPTKAREAVCAFANDLPGHGEAGVLFVGVRDDGTPTGLAITDLLLQTLADMKTDGNIVPPPSLTVEKRVLRGDDVAVVTVEPADAPPVRYQGRIFVRIGPRRGTATQQDERILNEKRRHGDRPFDTWPVREATLDDLDLRRFEEEYLPSAFAPDVIEANERSAAQRLAATKLVASAEDPTPTVLGLLVLSPRVRDFLPGAYVQFLRVAGTELGDPVADEAVLDGTLAEVIRRTEDKFKSHNRRAVDFTTEERERQTQPYPLPALQQLLRNAVMHRTYEATNAPVRVTWFDDRIEVHSPGGPYGVVTAETFGQPGVTDYRNPALAEALRVLGFVQRFGAGIATARRQLADNGNPAPAFEVTPTHVGVTVGAAA